LVIYTQNTRKEYILFKEACYEAERQGRSSYGSGDGIGQAIAAYFAAEGASVTVNCHERKAQETVDRIKKVGGNFIVVQADVSKADDVDRLISRTIENSGRLDILVNNAGIYRSHLAHETSEKNGTR